MFNKRKRNHSNKFHQIIITHRYYRYFINNLYETITKFLSTQQLVRSVALIMRFDLNRYLNWFHKNKVYTKYTQSILQSIINISKSIEL